MCSTWLLVLTGVNLFGGSAKSLDYRTIALDYSGLCLSRALELASTGPGRGCHLAFSVGGGGKPLFGLGAPRFRTHSSC